MLNHRPEAVQVAVVDRQVAAKGEVDSAAVAKVAAAKAVASPEVEPAGVAFNPQKPDPGRLPVSKR